MDFLYNSLCGRILLKILLNTKVLKLLAFLLHTSLSKIIIKPFILRHRINMSLYDDRTYLSYADFFIRKRKKLSIDMRPDMLISPCDGMLSVAPIREGTYFCVKNICYSINELIPDKVIADSFKDGLCMIFRLRATDYHHFCFIDDGYHGQSHYIEGMLHGVQPIALEKEPVFRVNRKVWSILDTEHFGCIAQIEVGAVLVGGIVLEKEKEYVSRGDEMGRFELCGSTIILLLQKDIADNLLLRKDIKACIGSDRECSVKIGHPVARLKNFQN